MPNPTILIKPALLAALFGLGASGAWASALRGETERHRGERGQEHRQDGQVLRPESVEAVHPRPSSPAGAPSTWSVPDSWRLRKAISTMKPVVAKPITMAVSTRACGSGSAMRS